MPSLQRKNSIAPLLEPKQYPYQDGNFRVRANRGKGRFFILSRLFFTHASIRTVFATVN
jgi:hypothetical protein